MSRWFSKIAHVDTSPRVDAWAASLPAPARPVEAGMTVTAPETEETPAGAVTTLEQLRSITHRHRVGVAS